MCLILGLNLFDIGKNMAIRKLSTPPLRTYDVSTMGCTQNVTYEKKRISEVVPGLQALVAKSSGFVGEISGEDTYRNFLSLKSLQKSGDILIFRGGKITASADFKFEQQPSPNMFFEIWSNWQGEKDSFNTLGWALSSLTDYVLYVFDGYPYIAVISLSHMRKWLGLRYNQPESIDMPALERQFRIRSQGKYQQMNKSVGCLIPFSKLPDDVLVGCIVMDEFDEWHYVKGQHFAAGLPDTFAGAFKEMPPVDMESRFFELL